MINNDMSNTFATITSIDFSAIIAEATAYIQQNNTAKDTSTSHFIGKATDIAAANVIPSIVSTFANTSISPSGVSLMVINTTSSTSSSVIPDDHPWMKYERSVMTRDGEHRSNYFPWPHDQIYLPILNYEGMSFEIFDPKPNSGNTADTTISAEQPIIIAANNISVPIPLSDGSSSYILQIIAPSDNSALFS
jgi:hypothetical protein